MRTRPWITSCRARPRKLIALAALSALAGSAAADPITAAIEDGYPDLPTLTMEELQALRGGFEIAGLKFDFAAELRTYVDGRLALETLINYTRNGTVTQHRPMPLSGAAGDTTATTTTPQDPAAGSATPGASPSVQLLGQGQGQTPAQLSLPGVDLRGLKDATGILINDRKGAVLALHEATRERIISTVVNQATGRDIRQELNVNVTVQNFQQFRDSLRSTILNGRLNAASR